MSDLAGDGNGAQTLDVYVLFLQLLLASLFSVVIILFGLSFLWWLLRLFLPLNDWILCWFSISLLLWLLPVIYLQVFVDLHLQFVLLFFIRVNELIVLSQSELSLIILPAAKQLSFFSQQDGEVSACSHVHYIFIAQFGDFNGIWTLLVCPHTQLSMLIESPPVIGPSLTLAHLGYSVISATPHIGHIGDAHTLESQTTLGFVSGVDTAADCVSLWLSTDVYLLGQQNGTVIAARDYFGKLGLRVTTITNSINVEQLRNLNWLDHLLPTHVLVVASEIDLPGTATREDRVVITCRDQIDRVIQLHLRRHLLRTVSSQSSFIIAAEGEDLAFNCGHHGMQGSAGNLEYTCVSERIGYGRSVGLFFLILIGLGLEALDI